MEVLRVESTQNPRQMGAIAAMSKLEELMLRLQSENKIGIERREDEIGLASPQKLAKTQSGIRWEAYASATVACSAITGIAFPMLLGKDGKGLQKASDLLFTVTSQGGTKFLSANTEGCRVEQRKGDIEEQEAREKRQTQQAVERDQKQAMSQITHALSNMCSPAA